MTTQQVEPAPERVGWRGVGAPVSYYSTDRKQDGGGAYLAVGRDPQDGQRCVSLWADTGERLWAVWMNDQAVRNLVAALTES